MDNQYLDLALPIVLPLLFWATLFYILDWQVRKRKKDLKKPIRIALIIVFGVICADLFQPLQPIVSQIFASSGIMAIVLGIAAQETLGNVFSGFMIFWCKPYQVGDLVKVNQGELIGFVERIRIRDTVIRTYESNRVLVPNSKMNTAIIENADFATAEKDNYLEIPVAYSADIKQVKQILL